MGIFLEGSQFITPGLWVSLPGRLNHEEASCDTNEFKVVYSDLG